MTALHRFRFSLLAFFACAFLVGCGTGTQQVATTSSTVLHGAVHGGQQPIAGASIQLYAAGTSSDGGAATPLLRLPVFSDANGGFSITGDYTCPTSSTLVYLAATGGNPGLAAGIQNVQLAELAALGQCGTLSASTFINVNELTTVAAVYGTVPYLTSVSTAGAAPANATLLANGFVFSAELVNTASGQAPGTGVPAGMTIPVAEINTLGDIVASCVNSSGGVAGDQSLCGQFLALTTVPGSSAPTNTVAGLINLANNPTLNTAALFQRVPAAAPFQPFLSQAPADFKIPSTAPVPNLVSLSPQAVSTGQPALVTLSGSGFVSNSVVQWNGSARPTTYISATSLQVSLSASDTASSGTDQLSVLNTAPGGGLSASLPLVVSSYSIPIITGISLSLDPVSATCSQIKVTVTGVNFNSYYSSLLVNGQVLSARLSGGALTADLPAGFSGTAANTSFVVTNNYGSGVPSNLFMAASSSSALFAVCTGSVGTVYPNSNYRLSFQPSQWNTAGSPVLNTLTLPTGMTATSTLPLTLAQSGTPVYVSVAAVSPATYTVPYTASLGSLTASGSLAVTVNSATPQSFGISSPLQNELGVPIGGSANTFFSTYGAYGSNYTATLSISGLPVGTTAVFTPAQIIPGDSFTLTIAAASSAPKTQNAQVLITATPSVNVSAPTATLYVDVTPQPGTSSGSRTDFTSTSGSPYAGAYDSVHNLIFTSNPDWNRVDILSSLTHKLIKSVPVRSPRGLDLSPDGMTVWVQTASQFLSAINTTSLQARQYALPDHTFGSSGAYVSINVTDRLLALSDGTVYLYFNDASIGGTGQAGIFNPQTGKLTRLSPGSNSISAWGTPMRSTDGTRVYASNNTYSTGIQVYDTATQVSSVIGSGTNFGPVAAVNRDGSVFLLNVNGVLTAYSRNAASQGSLPGKVSTFGSGTLLGGAVYSQDGTKIYVLGTLNNLSVVMTVDAATFRLLGTAPSMFTDPVGTSGFAGMTVPFGVDGTGLIFGLQNYGLGVEDAAYTQDYAAAQPGYNGEQEFISTYGGPLSGGTSISLGAYNGLIPDVWFGQTRGTAVVQVGGQPLITSPTVSIAGPVNIMLDYPDGTQAFYPQLFSYSTNPQFAVTSGSSPNGGAAAQVIGYGLPQDVSAGTVSVGGVAATVTTTTGQYPPLSSEPYPSTVLKYIFPQGQPGWADLQVTSTIGSGTLPKSIFYAKSVTDYASSDPLTAVLFDSKRNQVYLAAGDHVDVFSTTSNQFTTSLYPTAQGSKKHFTGLALTPDGSKLLVTDLLDGSLAVINPDSPSTSIAIPIAATTSTSSTCITGPLYVAAAANNQAFVTTGGMPAAGCPSSGITYIVNLQTAKVTRPAAYAQCSIGFLPVSGGFTDGFTVDASGDGTFVVIGNSTYNSACLYSAQSGTYLSLPSITYYGNSGASISSDGNIAGSGQSFADASGNLVGTAARPIPYYGNANTYNPPLPLLRPRLNASGSLSYTAYANWFDILDLAHATLRLRFALAETISATASPLAIDSGGRFVFLITTQGLTVVDLGEAPLSIGHLNPQTASPGTQIIVRGSGFDSRLTAKLGSAPATISVSDENTLQLTVPALSSGPQILSLPAPMEPLTPWRTASSFLRVSGPLFPV